MFSWFSILYANAKITYKKCFSIFSHFKICSAIRALDVYKIFKIRSWKIFQNVNFTEDNEDKFKY